MRDIQTVNTAGRVAWLSLTFLMCVVLWICNVGRVYLYGYPKDVLESLAQGAELVTFRQPANLAFLIGKSPWDPLWSATVFCILVVLLSFIILWRSLFQVWQNVVSPTLTCGALFLGGQTLWLTADTPTACLGVSFKALGIACLVAGKVPLMVGPVLGAAYCDPAAAVSLYLGLTFVAYKRLAKYGIPVTATSVLGAGMLLAMFCADYTLQPALTGLGGWSLLPLAALAWNKELRAARTGLYLTLLAASVVTGSAELASSICLGDLGLLALRIPAATAANTNPGEWRIRLSTGVQLLAVLALLASILPGEQYLNRRILIPAQEHDIPLPQLLVPFSLANHAERIDKDPWRDRKPFPGMRSQEVELLWTVKTPFRVLTVDQIAEDRVLSLVYSLLIRRPLTGWDTPDSLSSTSLICKAEKQNVLVEELTILFRGTEASSLAGGATLPDDLDNLPAVDFRRVLNIPFRPQRVSESQGTGYRLHYRDQSETLFFQKTQALLALSSTPRTYQIESLDNKRVRELEIGPLDLKLEAQDLNEVIPSRSLVPLDFKLTNLGRSPISTEELTSLTLGMEFNQPISPSEQQFPKEFVLFPEESISLQLFLATPEPEGRYELIASYKTVDGKSRPLKIEGGRVVNTWRRLPPVGTWIEEPEEP